MKRRREGASGDQPLLLAVAAERRTPIDLERLRGEVDEPDLAQLGPCIERQLERPVVPTARVHHLDGEQHVARPRMATE